MSQQLELALNITRKGSEHFARGEYPAAIHAYRLAGNTLPVRGHEQLKADLISLEALAFLEMAEFEHAISRCTLVLNTINPTHSDALFYRQFAERSMREPIVDGASEEAEEAEEEDEYAQRGRRPFSSKKPLLLQRTRQLNESSLYVRGNASLSAAEHELRRAAAIELVKLGMNETASGAYTAAVRSFRSAYRHAPLNETIIRSWALSNEAEALNKLHHYRWAASRANKALLLNRFNKHALAQRTVAEGFMRQRHHEMMSLRLGFATANLTKNATTTTPSSGLQATGVKPKTTTITATTATRATTKIGAADETSTKRSVPLWIGEQEQEQAPLQAAPKSTTSTRPTSVKTTCFEVKAETTTTTTTPSRGLQAATGVKQTTTTKPRGEHKIGNTSVMLFSGFPAWSFDNETSTSENATKAEKLNERGMQFLHTGNVSKAFEAFHEACANAPNDPLIWANQVFALVKMNRFDEAAVVARQAMDKLDEFIMVRAVYKPKIATNAALSSSS